MFFIISSSEEDFTNHVKATMPGKKALYCDSTDFIQEYVNHMTGEKQNVNLLKDFVKQGLFCRVIIFLFS